MKVDHFMVHNPQGAIAFRLTRFSNCVQVFAREHGRPNVKYRNAVT